MAKTNCTLPNGFLTGSAKRTLYNKKEVIAECRRELAINFEWPASQIMALHGEKIGLTAAQMKKELAKGGR